MAKLLPNKHLIVVVGPTAVGKTAVGVKLAQHFNTEIVSADARQCYQHMAIGTAQPTAEDQQGIPHHLINFLPIQATYSAGKFEQDALSTLNRLFNKHNQVILTGGSGLYIQAVCEGLHNIPEIGPTIKAYLNTRLQQEGLPALAGELATQDHAYYQTVDQHNPHRILRALAVCLATGKPYSLLRASPLPARPFRITKIGLTRDRPRLYERINQRVDQMLQQGLLTEARALYEYKEYNSLKTVGYQEIFAYLAGIRSREATVALIKANTRRYAKRQLTWFRKDQAIRWFHPDDLEGIVTYATKLLP